MDRKTKGEDYENKESIGSWGVTLLAAGVLAACSGGSGAKR